MKKTWILFALAVLGILFAHVEKASCYFSTRAEAVGGYRVEGLDSSRETEMTEEVSNWTKTVTIKNNSTSPVYVRIRPFSATETNVEAENWRKDGDYWYYGKSKSQLLPGGQETKPFLVHIKEPKKDDFHVIVVYETIPVTYDEKGNPIENWNLKER